MRGRFLATVTRRNPRTYSQTAGRLGPLVLGLGLAVGFCGTARAALVIAESLLVSLHAQDLPLGVMTDNWMNLGSLAGDFVPNGDPTVEDINDGTITARAVRFDGAGDYLQGPISVPGIEGSGTRSIEVWAHNPAIIGEETVVAWAHRGGPDGSNMSFNYGNDGRWGAVGHWGGTTFDMGWGGNNNPNPDPETPAAAQWHHVVYTYDGSVAQVYADGVFKNDRAVGALGTHGGDPIRVGSQNSSAGGGDIALPASLDIAAVRIHDGVLSADDVLNNYNEGISALPFGDVLYWDGSLGAEGQWGTAHWTNPNPPPPPPNWPNADIGAIIDVADAVVTVEADHAAHFLRILQGELVVGSGNTLDVVTSISGTAVGLEDDAELTAGEGGVLEEVAISGDATIDTGGSLSGVLVDDGQTAGVFTKKGVGTFSVNADDSDLGVTTLKLDDGTLKLTGADPMAGATQVTLSGGAFSLHPTLGLASLGGASGGGTVGPQDLLCEAAPPVAGPGAAVPEPGTLTLVVAGLLAFALWRRGRGHSGVPGNRPGNACNSRRVC